MDREKLELFVRLWLQDNNPENTDIDPDVGLQRTRINGKDLIDLIEAVLEYYEDNMA